MSSKSIIVLRGLGEPEALELSRKIGSATSGVERLVVSVVDPQLMELASLPAPTRGATAIVEAWTSEADAVDMLGSFGSEHILGAWMINEIVQKDFSNDRSLATPSPGIKTMFFVSRLPCLTQAEFFAHWEHVHGPLANRVHVGCNRYVQNQILRTIGPVTWKMDGVSELYFPTEHALLNGFHVDADGRRDVGRDVKTFVGPTEAYATTEYLLIDSGR